MADSEDNAPSTEKHEAEMAKMADSEDNAPSTEKHEAEMAKMADSEDNAPSTEKHEAKMADSEDNASSTQKHEIKTDNNKSALDKEKIIGTATSEMEYRVELFNRLTHTCFNKCVEKRYKEGELHIGENSCIDRCVSKYWQVNNIIGRVLAYNRRGT